MKKNFLFGLIGAGALILSGSVGFAAWTINVKNDINKDASLGVSADGTITDNRIKLDANSKFQTGFDSIAFVPVVPVSDANITSPWLNADPLASAEKLTIKYDLIVTGGDNLTVSANASIVDEGKDTKFTSLIDEGVIGALPTNIKVSLTKEISPTGTTYKGTIEAPFTWGTHFTSTKTHTPVNPYTYYNEQDYSDSLANDANESIAKLQNIQNYSGLKLKYIVSAK